MKQIKAVIFDMDGVMFDTERLSAELWQELGQEMGFAAGENLLRRVRGNNIEQVKAAFRMHFGEGFPLEEVFRRKRALMEERLERDGVPVKRGLRELLDWLREEGYKLAVATGSSRERVLKNLRDAGVEGYFEQLVCGDQVPVSKPDPAIFLLAAQRLGVEPGHCLVLEDSLNGVEAALAGGFVTVMVPDLLQPEAALRQRLDGVCEDLTAVIGFLRG